MCQPKQGPSLVDHWIKYVAYIVSYTQCMHNHVFFFAQLGKLIMTWSTVNASVLTFFTSCLNKILPCKATRLHLYALYAPVYKYYCVAAIRINDLIHEHIIACSEQVTTCHGVFTHGSSRAIDTAYSSYVYQSQWQWGYSLHKYTPMHTHGS